MADPVALGEGGTERLRATRDLPASDSEVQLWGLGSHLTSPRLSFLVCRMELWVPYRVSAGLSSGAFHRT